jgi:polysaccharide export outer membrane protein
VLVSSGDLLAVSVLGAPDYHYDVRVSSSGEISLPMVGSIKVAGLTTPQAETTIAQALQKQGFFNDPRVSVFVKEYSTSGTSVLGEVQHPGIYPLLGHRTLLDALSAAGGTTPRAGKSVTITHRDHPETAEMIMLSSSDGQKMTNIRVLPGDTIVVSKAGVVYVVGDVKEPTGIIMDNPRFTVLQAIAMAHGTNPTAKMGSAKLIRRVDGVPQEIPIPLNKILSAKSTDIALQADDIVFVPNSAVKTATSKGLDAALQAATGVAIYGRY